MSIRRVATATAFGLTVLAGAAPAAQASGGDAYPCGGTYQHDGYLVQNCPDWSPTGSIPVHAAPRSSSVVGYINPSGNDWYLCQKRGGDFRLGKYRNNWWAPTKADNGRWGFVSEVYFRGGGDYDAEGGLRVCQGNPGGKPLPE